MWFELIEEAKKKMLLSAFKKAINLKPTYLALGRRGKYMSCAASLILVINVWWAGVLDACAFSNLLWPKTILSLHAFSNLLWPKTILSFSTANFAMKQPAMHKMISTWRSSSMYKWLQSGMLLSLSSSFLKLCLAETCRCTTDPPRLFWLRAAKGCVPNNSRALTWMTLLENCKSLLPVVNAGAQAQRSWRWLPPWPPRLLRNTQPDRGTIRRLAYEHVVFVDAHSRLPCQQGRLGFQLNTDVICKLCWQTGRGHQDDPPELAVAGTSSSCCQHRCRFDSPTQFSPFSTLLVRSCIPSIQFRPQQHNSFPVRKM